jgi:alpha-glucosidase (family GH31 glycosyl hydrolase)
LFGEFAGGDQVSMYKAIPYYTTSKNMALFLSNKCYSRFDFNNDHIKIKICSRHVKGRLIVGNNPKEILLEYSSICGRMKSLPEWALDGVILGIQGGEAVVKKIVDQTLKADVPVSGIWLQDWCGKRIQTMLGRTLKRLWWNWEPDFELYPNWNDFVKEMEEKNINVLSYINTFLADVEKGGKSTFTENYYAVAKKRGFLVQESSSKEPLNIVSGPNFTAGLLDIFNPQAFEWMKEILIKHYKSGIKGFMADFGNNYRF